MIGNKKIEEAARLDDKEYYDRLSDNDRCFFEYGFRRGYNRAVSSRWFGIKAMPVSVWSTPNFLFSTQQIL